MTWYVPDEYLHLVESEQPSDHSSNEEQSLFAFTMYAEPWHGLALDTDISLFLSDADK